MNPFVTEITRYDDLPLDHSYDGFQPNANSQTEHIWVPFGTTKNVVLTAAHQIGINSCIASNAVFHNVHVLSIQRLNTGIMSYCGKFENPLRVDDGDTIFCCVEGADPYYIDVECFYELTCVGLPQSYTKTLVCIPKSTYTNINPRGDSRGWPVVSLDALADGQALTAVPVFAIVERVAV